MPRYEFSDGTSRKFWQIELAGASFTTTYGRIGTAGQASTKNFTDEGKARAEYEKLIAEKVKKGYVLVGDSSGTTETRPAAKAAAAPPAAKPASPRGASASKQASRGAARTFGILEERVVWTREVEAAAAEYEEEWQGSERRRLENSGFVSRSPEVPTEAATTRSPDERDELAKLAVPEELASLFDRVRALDATRKFAPSIDSEVESLLALLTTDRAYEGPEDEQGRRIWISYPVVLIDRWARVGGMAVLLKTFAQAWDFIVGRRSVERRADLEDEMDSIEENHAFDKLTRSLAQFFIDRPDRQKAAHAEAAKLYAAWPFELQVAVAYGTFDATKASQLAKQALKDPSITMLRASWRNLARAVADLDVLVPLWERVWERRNSGYVEPCALVIDAYARWVVSADKASARAAAVQVRQTAPLSLRACLSCALGDPALASEDVATALERAEALDLSDSDGRHRLGRICQGLANLADDPALIGRAFRCFTGKGSDAQGINVVRLARQFGLRAADTVGAIVGAIPEVYGESRSGISILGALEAAGSARELARMVENKSWVSSAESFFARRPDLALAALGEAILVDKSKKAGPIAKKLAAEHPDVLAELANVLPAATMEALTRPGKATSKSSAAGSSEKAGARPAAPVSENVACFGGLVAKPLERMKTWLTENGFEDRVDDLRAGASEKQLAAIGKKLGVRLSDDLRELWSTHAGQASEPGEGLEFFGRPMQFVGPDDVVDVREGLLGSLPDPKARASDELWKGIPKSARDFNKLIPFATDEDLHLFVAVNVMSLYVYSIDHKDVPMVRVAAPSLGEWLEKRLEELETGERTFD